MRLLNLQNRQRRKRRSQQGYAAIIQTRRDDVDQQDRQQIPEGRNLSSNEVNLIVTGLSDPARDISDNDDRQITVNKKTVTAVLRVQWRTIGIEISAPLLAVGHHADISLAPLLISRRSAADPIMDPVNCSLVPEHSPPSSGTVHQDADARSDPSSNRSRGK